VHFLTNSRRELHNKRVGSVRDVEDDVDADASGGEATRPAGDFGAWLAATARAVRGDATADVPCDGCTACCTSSQFVVVGPDETETLARIPPELRFPAPRRPAGTIVLGYDDRGHCPMLVAGACSIYEHRPQTCRTYDCRVLAAAGVDLDDDDKAEIAARARSWRFTYPTAADRVAHEAVKAAARYVADHPDRLPDDAVPVNATQRAVLAVEVHGAFLVDEPAGPAVVADPPAEAVRVFLTARKDHRRA
jgi:hypothetical protein